MATQTLRRSVSLGTGDVKLEVSPLCLGMTGDPDTVLAAWDAGINFFFVTADMHWPLYETLREGLRRLAKARPASVDEAVIAVCTYVAQPEFLTSPAQEVLAELAPFKRFGVTVIGGAYSADWEKRVSIAKRNIATQATPSKLVGVSLHDRKAGVDIVNQDGADLVFVRYNARHPGARLDFFPELKADRRTKVFNFKSTMGYIWPKRLEALNIDPELWLPSVTDHYRFALAAKVDGILCSPGSPAEVETLVEAYNAGPLTDDEEQHLMALAKLVVDDDLEKAKKQHDAAGAAAPQPA